MTDCGWFREARIVNIFRGGVITARRALLLEIMSVYGMGAVQPRGGDERGRKAARQAVNEPPGG